MMLGITGTPGTGKTSAADELRKRGFSVVDLKTTVSPYIIGNEDGSDIVDTDRWAAEFPRTDGYVEGSIAHYLPCDRLIILRCRPDILKTRLFARGYSESKLKENAEAEALDAILIEAVEMFEPKQLFEIDTTNIDTEKTVDLIEAFAAGKIPPAFGSIDWSEYVVSL